MGAFDMLNKWLRPKHTQVVEDHKVKQALDIARLEQRAEELKKIAERIERQSVIGDAPKDENGEDPVTVPPIDEEQPSS